MDRGEGRCTSSSKRQSDHDNRNNSIKRSGILFSRTDRGGCRGNINWERRGDIAVVDTTKTGQCSLFEQGKFYSQLFAPLLGHEGLKIENGRETIKQGVVEKRAFMSHYEEDIQSWNMTIFTVYQEEERQGERDKLISSQSLVGLVPVILNSASSESPRMKLSDCCFLSQPRIFNLQWETTEKSISLSHFSIWNQHVWHHLNLIIIF